VLHYWNAADSTAESCAAADPEKTLAGGKFTINLEKIT